MAPRLRAPEHDRTRDAHTRRVRFLKVSLPLVALGILSSLFLFSRSITMDGALPFAEVDVADRLREPKMTDVTLATASENGSLISMTAAKVVPSQNGPVTSSDVQGTIKSRSGDVIGLTAAHIQYSNGAETAALTGGVLITSAGYDMTTEALDLALQSATLASRGAVRAVGPLGQLDAGLMSANQTTEGAVIVFKSGVTLLYTPQK
jgi:lipopolysaccharide export system protein LptC